MEPTGKIPPQPWMTAPETRAVVAALRAAGIEARFVGGCVRDAVLKRSVDDVDLATPAPPEVVMAALGAAGIKVVPTGLKHGTVSVFAGDFRYEITTLRRDLQTDGRRAKVAFTDDWIADAARRDFTINTLSATPEGDVFDPFDGLADLGAGWVRFVGNARERVEEDHLRALRYFRFYACFGRPPPDADALEACRGIAPKLPRLSGERIREELFKILLAPNAADTVALMLGERVFEHILPEIADIGRLRAVAWLESSALRRDAIAPDALRRLAAALAVDRAGAEAVARRLRLSNRQRARLAEIAAPSHGIIPETPTLHLDRVLYRLGMDLARDLALLAWGGERAAGQGCGSARTADWMALLEFFDSWRVPRFPLSGADVQALGVASGPRVGAALAAVEDWWIDGGFRADRAACLARLAKVV